MCGLAPARAGRRARPPSKAPAMADLAYLVMTLAFFALAALLVGFIDRRSSR